MLKVKPLKIKKAVQPSTEGKVEAAFAKAFPEPQTTPTGKSPVQAALETVAATPKMLGQYEVVKNTETGNEFIVLGKSPDGYKLSYRLALKHGAGCMLEFRIRIGDRDEEPLTVDDIQCPLDLEALAMGGKDKNYRSISGYFQTTSPAWNQSQVAADMVKADFIAKTYEAFAELFPTIELMPFDEFDQLMWNMLKKATQDLPTPDELKAKVAWRFGLHPVIVEYPVKKMTNAEAAGL